MLAAASNTAPCHHVRPRALQTIPYSALCAGSKGPVVGIGMSTRDVSAAVAGAAVCLQGPHLRRLLWGGGMELGSPSGRGWPLGEAGRPKEHPMATTTALTALCGHLLVPNCLMRRIHKPNTV